MTRGTFPPSCSCPTSPHCPRDSTPPGRRPTPRRKRWWTRPDVRSLYAAIVDTVNARLAQYERIKKFSLLSREFTLTGGELTPTLKVKRRIIEERYRAEIEAMYTGSAP